MLDVLIVEDDESTRSLLADLVSSLGFSARTAGDLENARCSLNESPPDVLVLDLKLPDGQGTDLIAELDDLSSCPDVVILTGHATVATAVEALRSGATDYLTKPLDVERFNAILAHIALAHQLREEIAALRGELRSFGRFGKLIGASAPMQEVYDLISKVAPTNATVLLIGESGTGKELAAETIQRLSRRSTAQFVALNCGAISPNLIESELFGHVRGSFTGATSSHKGIFERAHGGTLFLDEITEMPVDLQVKLLRALETSAVSPVGSDGPVKVDTRVIAATNRDPHEAVNEGRLRDDLYYRLQVFPITLPALVDREGDVRLLVATFLHQLANEYGCEKQIQEEALEALERYSWPGNVRELRNVLNRAYIMADEKIGPDHLHFSHRHAVGRASAQGGNGTAHASASNPGVNVDGTLAEAERTLVLAALERADGNKREAAKSLGISIRTLYNRLREYRVSGNS